MSLVVLRLHYLESVAPDEIARQLGPRFGGSPSGAVECNRWYEPSDPSTWGDNYLCYY